MPPPSLSEALFTIAECATSSGGAGAFGRDPGTLARAVVAVDERAEHAQGGRRGRRGPIVVAAELGQAGRDDAAGAEAGDADAAQAEGALRDAGARQRQARILRERHVAEPRPSGLAVRRPKRDRRTTGRSASTAKPGAAAIVALPLAPSAMPISVPGRKAQRLAHRVRRPGLEDDARGAVRVGAFVHRTAAAPPPRPPRGCRSGRPALGRRQSPTACRRRSPRPSPPPSVRSPRRSTSMRPSPPSGGGLPAAATGDGAQERGAEQGRRRPQRRMSRSRRPSRLAEKTQRRARRYAGLVQRSWRLARANGPPVPV